MKSIIIIPARYDSTRLRGKPLLKKTGKYLVQHVYEQAVGSIADMVVVATDDICIKEAVEGFGGVAVLTKHTHRTGTERVAEASNFFPEYEIVINLQGDEPEVNSNSINTIIGIQQRENPFMSTICAPFSSYNYNSCTYPSCTKVVLGKQIYSTEFDIRQALYFSRSLIPYYRANNQDLSSGNNYFLHIGMYAYSRKTLLNFVELPMGELENAESLEQLRALENGYNILCGIVNDSHVGIDTHEDYDLFVQRYKKQI